MTANESHTTHYSNQGLLGNSISEEGAKTMWLGNVTPTENQKFPK